MGNEFSLTFFILILAVLANIALGFVVFTRNTRARLNRRFFLLTIFVSSWVFTNLLFPVVTDDFRLLLALLSYASAGLLALMFVLFCADITNYKLKPAREKLIIGTGVTVSVLSALPGVIATSVSSDLTIDTNMPQLVVYGLYVFGSLVTAIGLLINRLRTAPKRERARIKIVLWGMAFGVVIGVVFNLLLPLVNEYRFTQYGPLGSLIFMAMTGYAIVRHGLFDIKRAAIRTIAYVLSLGTLSLVYFLLAYIASLLFFQDSITTGVSFSPINITLALVLAFIFQPVKQFFDRVTDSIFYRDRYNVDELIGKLGHTLTSTANLTTMLRRAGELIESTLKASHTTFIVLRGEHMTPTVSSSSKNEYTSEEVRSLIALIDGTDEILFVDQLSETPELKHEYGHIISQLKKQHVALVLPLMQAGGPIGVLLIGEHLSSYFSKRDTRVLEAVSDELVVAIQNARTLQELRDLNKNLEKRISEATEELLVSNEKLRKLDEAKDEFISMASHQLRTPLTSVKGLISMMLEGDVGKISSDQRKVLEQAYASSQRMVFLIGDFLNISRIQTGKFEIEPSVLNLAELTREEVEQLFDTAKGRQITLEYHPPTTFPDMVVDENKLRQVMMNFIDNALYYSPANTSVRVQLYKDGSDAVFKVTDAGIGVPKSERPKLFTKFYRASNARKQRPDGTGIGLYMAKKVIVAHGGSVIFESTEGKGSTFGFRLPLKNDLKKLD